MSQALLGVICKMGKHVCGILQRYSSMSGRGKAVEDAAVELSNKARMQAVKIIFSTYYNSQTAF